MKVVGFLFFFSVTSFFDLSSYTGWLLDGVCSWLQTLKWIKENWKGLGGTVRGFVSRGDIFIKHGCSVGVCVHVCVGSPCLPQAACTGQLLLSRLLHFPLGLLGKRQRIRMGLRKACSFMNLGWRRRDLWIDGMGNGKRGRTHQSVPAVEPGKEVKALPWLPGWRTQAC